MEVKNIFHNFDGIPKSAFLINSPLIPKAVIDRLRVGVCRKTLTFPNSPLYLVHVSQSSQYLKCWRTKWKKK